MAQDSNALSVSGSSSDNTVDIYVGIEALANFKSLLEKFNFPEGMFDTNFFS